MPFTTMDALIGDIQKSLEMTDPNEEYHRRFRKVVSTRLDAVDVANLEAIAKLYGMSRTACLELLQETAIFQVSSALGVRSTNTRLDEEDGKVTVTREDGSTVQVEDDALIIGGGEDK